MRFKIGDSIKVKPGVRDPDSGAEISDYQGRIVEIDEPDLYAIRWDSHTLKKLPPSYIKEAEQKGLGWDSFYLNETDIEPATPRDTENEVEEIFYQLQHEFFWVHLGEQGYRISTVLSGVSLNNEKDEFNAWENHLKNTLTFPFQAEVSEWQETGPLKCDEVVTVYRLLDTGKVDLDHGLFVEVKNKKSHCAFPLSDLEVVDRQSKDFMPVKDYAVWFANR